MALTLSLTYDGTQLCHLETVVPQLGAFGFQGTFYADPVNLLERINGWRQAAGLGHEVGNGCLTGAALPDGSLPAWTPGMILEEVEDSDRLLRESFPHTSGHSLGLPWGQARCAEGQIYLAQLGIVADVIRTGDHGANEGKPSELKSLRCYMLANMAGDDMISVLRLALQKGGWAIFAFDGIGCGERGVDASAHNDLCQFIDGNRDLIDVRTVIGMSRQLSGLPVTQLKLS